MQTADIMASFGIYDALTAGFTHVDKLRNHLEESPWHLDFKAKDGSTLLHAAAQGGDIDVFNFLVNEGLNPHGVTKNRHTVLHKACITGKYNMVQYLVNMYPDLTFKEDIAKKNALYFLAESGNTEIFKYLTEKGLDPYHSSTSGVTVLLRASWNGQVEMVKFLVENYPKLKTLSDNIDQNALHWTAISGSIPMFEYLVDKGLDPMSITKTGQTVLSEACWSNKLDMVAYLVNKYPQLKEMRDNNNFNALHWAAREGHVKLFSYLAKQGIDPYEVDNQGRTVLHIASVWKRFKMVKYLVAEYPDLKNRTDNKNQTALHTAVRDDNRKIVDFLFDEGVNPYDTTDSGETMLNFVCENGTHDLVDTLLLKFPGLKPRKRSDSDGPGASGYSRPAPDSPTSSPASSDDNLSDFEGEVEAREDKDRDHQDLPFSHKKIKRYIKQKGRSSTEAKSLLKWLCSHVKASYPNAEEIWPGYRTKDQSSDMVLVAMMNGEYKDHTKSTDPFKIVFRQKRTVSQEGAEVHQMEVESGYQFTEKESSALKQCIKKHSKNLMEKHGNIQVIRASKLKSVGYGTDCPRIEKRTCIVIYVPVKGIRPFDEGLLPNVLDGFPVDVREGFFWPQSNPVMCEYHEKLLMGCEIGSANWSSGALGGFVELPKGGIGCLTCWHMFLSQEQQDNPETAMAQFREDVYQPCHIRPEYKFGKLIGAVHHSGNPSLPDENASTGVDAALIEITDEKRYPDSGMFPEGAKFPDAPRNMAGLCTDKPMVYNSGKVVTDLSTLPRPCCVVKNGPATGITLGILGFTETSVRKKEFMIQINDHPQSYILYNQLEVHHIHQTTVFSDNGDSGSLVLTVIPTEDGHDMQALGMLVGGTSSGISIVTPLCVILDRLQLPPKLLAFESNFETGKQTAVGDDSRLMKVETDVAEMKQHLGNIDTKMKTFDTKMQNLDQKIDKKMDTIDTTMQTFGNLLQGISDHIKKKK